MLGGVGVWACGRGDWWGKLGLSGRVILAGHRGPHIPGISDDHRPPHLHNPLVHKDPEAMFCKQAEHNNYKFTTDGKGNPMAIREQSISLAPITFALCAAHFRLRC